MIKRVILGLALFAFTVRADELFPSLKANGQVYSRVTVFKATATDIYFTSAQGMANAKLKDLDPALQKHFHYDPVKAAQIEREQAAATARYQLAAMQQISSRAPEEKPAARSATGAPVKPADRPDYNKATLTRVGDKSPVLSVQTVDGRKVDFRNKVVVLDFFATWCEPCLEEMPYLEKYVQPLSRNGVILVAIGREHSPAEVLAFQKRSKYSFLFAADPKREIYGRFATYYIPRCVVIGKDGLVKFQSVGLSGKDFTTLIETARNESQK